MAEAHPLGLLLKYKSNSIKSHKKHQAHPFVYPQRQKSGFFFPNETIFQGGDGGDGGVQTYYSRRTVYRPTGSNTICVTSRKKIQFVFLFKKVSYSGPLGKPRHFTAVRFRALQGASDTKMTEQVLGHGHRGEGRRREDCRRL